VRVEMMMSVANRLGRGVWIVVLAVLVGGGVVHAQTLPGDAPAASAPAIAATLPATSEPATTAEARKPTVDELLPGKAVAFDFVGRPIGEVMDFIATSYGVRIVNNYQDKLNQTITFKPAQPLKAREAINTLNSTLVALGYTVVDSVKGDPPQVILTILPTKVDDSATVPVFYGNDATKIPEGDNLRTQIFTLKSIDPATVKETVSAVLGKRADVTVNSSTRTMIITDTSSHIHTAAALLEVLDKQAGEKGK
jgi:type II secretory pathway component GspD/PulD (secretin)